MRVMTGALVAVLAAAPLTSIRAQEGAGTTVTYEEFMELDLQSRIRRFNEIAADNRAHIVRTQAQRWLAKNRHRLSPEQVAVMEENIAFISARLYELPKTPEILNKSKELETKSVALLGRDDIVQALTIRGAYIPR